MTASDMRERADAVLRERAAPLRVPLVGLGALLLVAGCLTPWSTYAGFPGKMTLSGNPGGARLYVLVLGLLATVLLFSSWGGRRGAARVASLGALGIAVFTLGAIAKQGGGLVNVDYGAWLAVAGSVLVFAGVTGLPDDSEAVGPPRLPAVVEILVIAAAMALVLFGFVKALEIEESSLFVGYLAFLFVGAAALSKLGLFRWLSGIGERYRTITLTAAAITAIVFPFTQDGDSYYLRVAASIGVFAAAAIGLNIVVGLAGLLDLGYVAFFGVGAYVGALFSGAASSTIDIRLPFLVVVFLGAVVAATFGVLIGAPTLRLRGDYLAIVTLGFGEIFRIAVNNLDGADGPDVTNGPNGISGIPQLGLPGGFNFNDAHEVLGVSLPGFANYYYAELVLLFFVILAFTRLNNSRIGRAWVAIREDEVAATAMGIKTIRLKLLAFGIGAFLAGAAGTLNSHVTSQVSPDSYTFLESIFLLAAVVLGGMGTIPGALLGSTLLILLPEKLRAFADNRLLLFGLALVLVMRFRPEGMVPNRQRQREFHDAEGGADATGAPPGAPVAAGAPA